MALPYRGPPGEHIQLRKIAGEDDAVSPEHLEDEGLGGIYRPIRSWQTRVLKLYSGSEDEILAGSLLVANIVTRPGLALQDELELIDFDAISYTWEGQKELEPIVLNGKRTLITPNLEDALKRFRYPDRHRYLWADAVCINQKEDQEKSEQVRQMFTIFSKARETLVWLGRDGDHTSDAIAFIHSRTREIKGERIEYPTAPTQEQYFGLVDLCTRPWSRRAWIQQEVFASKLVSCYCGTGVISLQQYKDVASSFLTPTSSQHLTAEQEACYVAVENLTQSTAKDIMELERQRFPGETGFCYRFLLDEKQRSKCTKPECVIRKYRHVEAGDIRDRVYALLALTSCRINEKEETAQERGSESLRIDYSRTTSQVFQDLTKYIINRDRSLNVLVFHSSIDNAENDLGLPSWTPDWRICASHTLNSVRDPFEGLGEFNWQNEAEDGLIKFAGVIFGFIAERKTDHFSHRYFCIATRPEEFHTLFAHDWTRSRYQLSGAFSWSEFGAYKFKRGDILVRAQNTHFGKILRYRAAGGWTYVAPLFGIPLHAFDDGRHLGFLGPKLPSGQQNSISLEDILENCTKEQISSFRKEFEVY